MSNEFINYATKVALKTALHVFWLFPVEKGKITLLNELSYTYGDSMKYIDEYIHQSDKNRYKVVFPIKRGGTPSEYPEDIVVTPHSFAYYRQLLTSEAIVTNAGGVSYLPKRKGQTFINTWHGGGPYKKTSTDVYHSYWYRKQVRMNADNTDFILSSCRDCTESELVSMGYNAEKIVPAGLPRNDILFRDYQDIRRKVRAFYSIPDDVKFVLFAPTFRSKGAEFANMDVAEDYVELDVDTLLAVLEEKYQCQWVCGIRLHPKLADTDMSGLNAVNCSTYPDMQELLCCADAVVSDYSSLIWDYSFTYRPVFLYAPDIERYERERGFYMPSNEWPYPIAHNNNELRDNILHFDPDAYVQRVKEHHTASGSYETGKACEKIFELLKAVTAHGD